MTFSFSVVFGELNPHLVAVVTASVQLLASMASGVLADKLGRRPLLIASSLVMSLTLTGFGLYTYLCAHKPSGRLGKTSNEIMGQLLQFP